MYRTDMMSLKDLPTPALVIDLNGLESNISAMAEFLTGKKTTLRPHIKTHKCPAIAHMQVKAGAKGITCAKIGEAEVMALAGLDDILIATQIMGVDKLHRLAGLARRTSLTVAVDDLKNVRDIADMAVRYGSTIGILIEVDTGMGRSGIRTADSAVELAKAASTLKGVKFRGFMGFEGHCESIVNSDERKKETDKANSRIDDAVKADRSHGFDVEIVSAGGTITYALTAGYPGITEIQSGTYVFMDANYDVHKTVFKPCLTVLATVVGVYGDGNVVLDAGSKSLSIESGMPIVKDRNDLKFLRFSEEHGVVTAENGKMDLKTGDKIEIIPSHVCTTVNLYDMYWGMRDGHLELTWPVSARGKVV